jgi:hypothetical protein
MARDVTVTRTQRGLELTTPWCADFLSDLKTKIPGYARKWDADDRVWLISPAYGGVANALIITHYGVNLGITDEVVRATVVRDLGVRYLGTVKRRPDGGETAWGHDGTDWAFVFPVDVLRAFFGAAGRPAAARTFYSTLCVASTASDPEVRQAYRRMVRQWHPDVCSEAGASDQFKAITRAYDVLRDPVSRQRYDAGLVFGAQTDDGKEFDIVYAPPLRCGWVRAEVETGLTSVLVSRILSWSDIVDSEGRTLVSSWPRGGDTYVERWVNGSD